VSWHSNCSSGLLQNRLYSFKVFFEGFVHVATYSLRFSSSFKVLILSPASISSCVNSFREKAFFKPVATMGAFCLVTRFISLSV